MSLVSKPRLAYDRSLRHYDHDRKLHVELTPISKSNICPYYGEEIPDLDGSLQLEPRKIYYLFRDNEELKKGAETSNNMQLLRAHKVVSPDEPQKMDVVGSTGTDAMFAMPFLKNSLVIWDQDAIDLIESNRKKQLSCAYHYRADMTPGTYLGAPYDGVMRDIKFNHVALVEDGRAGADVLVADELPASMAYDSMPLDLLGDLKPMPTTSPRALVARGALTAFLKPRLAQDASIDFKSVLLGTTTQNWGQAKPVIVARVHAATRGRLAKDANLDGLELALDSLDDEKAEDEWPDEDEDDDDDKKSKAKDKKAKDKAAKDETAEAEMKAKDKAKDEDFDAMDEDDEDEDDKDDKKKDAKDKKAKDKKAMDQLDPHPLTKAAMDAAIEAAVLATETRMREATRALREAEEIVAPAIGKIIAQDSASAVYELLFKSEGVDVKSVPPEAYKVLAQQIVKGKSKAAPKMVAVDSAMVSNFTTRFPDAANVRHI